MEFHRWMGVRPFRRHSLVLTVAGIIYMAIGTSYIVADPTPGRTEALVFAFDWAPQEAWGAIFGAAGLIALISSRWPPFAETWGYTVLTGLSAVWAAFYFFGIAFANSPVANIVQVFTWALIAVIWWAISGLLSPVIVVQKGELNADNE